MKTIAFYMLAMLALLAAILSISSCESKVKVVNEPPGNLVLSVSKCFIETGGTVALSGSALDDDGDPLTFRWIATAGTFSPATATGSSVQWTAPETPGAVTIIMVVTDEIATVTKTQTVTVCVPIQGSITNNMTIANTGSVYIVKAATPLLIAGTATLTIEPGVTVVFDGAGAGFEAFGRIVAEGNASEKIRFRGNTCGFSSGLWDGIYIDGQGGQHSEAIFRHVELSASLNGIQVMGGGKLTLEECTVYDNSNRGISVLTDASVAHILSSRIWDNGIGIEVENATVDIKSSSIQYNLSNGLECSHSFSDPVVTIDSTSISNNGDNGILLSSRANPVMHYCTISGNGEVTGWGYAIRLGGHTGSDPIDAENNFWGVGNTNEQKIGVVIFDGADGAGLALVDFNPWLGESPVALRAVPAGIAKERSWAR